MNRYIPEFIWCLREDLSLCGEGWPVFFVWVFDCWSGIQGTELAISHNWTFWQRKLNQVYWCTILIAHQIVMAKHGGSCVHFSGISTCGRTSRETVSHPQCPPFPTLCKISLPIYVIVTNKLLQPLTTIWYDSLVLSFAFFENLTTFN